MPAPHSGFLIQGSSGAVGNFEMVTPSPFGGLAHCWRDNDAPGLPWNGPTYFGSGDVAAVSLIQSTFGDPGHLEVVARVGDQLFTYWRDHLPPFVWFGPFPLVGGVSGNPALIQGSFGGVGNFELVVPLAGGGLAHYGRDNDAPGLPWSGATAFGAGVGQVDAVALLQSTFGDPGNLEVVARVGANLVLFWREVGAALHLAWPLPDPRPRPAGRRRADRDAGLHPGQLRRRRQLRGRLPANDGRSGPHRARQRRLAAGLEPADRLRRRSGRLGRPHPEQLRDARPRQPGGPGPRRRPGRPLLARGHAALRLAWADRDRLPGDRRRPGGRGRVAHPLLVGGRRHPRLTAPHRQDPVLRL